MDIVVIVLDYIHVLSSPVKNFNADINSSVHVYNKKKDILVPDEGPIQGINDTAINAEANYPVNFIQSGKTFVLSLPYDQIMKAIVSYLLMKYKFIKLIFFRVAGGRGLQNCTPSTISKFL